LHHAGGCKRGSAAQHFGFGTLAISISSLARRSAVYKPTALLVARHAWIPAVALQVVLSWLYLDIPRALANPPLADTDFATHWVETWSMAHFLERGRLWGYDPYFMAGYPGNALFDIDNKLVALASWLLSRTGLSLELSYTLVMAALLLVAPLTIYPAARWLGLAPGSALIAQLVGLALWYIDPALRWSWRPAAASCGRERVRVADRSSFGWSSDRCSSGCMASASSCCSCRSRRWRSSAGPGQAGLSAYCWWPGRCWSCPSTCPG
jgi:hypothetical protein